MQTYTIENKKKEARMKKYLGNASIITAAPPWILWFIANTLSFFARKSWKLEEWFFQAMTAIISAVIVILSIRS